MIFEQLSNVPPSNGIFYKPFEKPKDTAKDLLDSKTLELMIKVKKIQDDADKAGKVKIILLVVVNVVKYIFLKTFFLFLTHFFFLLFFSFNVH